MSQFKVRVVSSFGSDSTIGLMDPAVGMVTQFGTIAAVENATGICTMGDTSSHVHGGRQRFYSHDLMVLASTVSGFGWPTTGGSVRFGHQSEDVLEAAQLDRQKAHTYMGPGGVPHTDFYP